MKKFVKYIFVMLVFLGFTNGVSAKEVENTCTYEGNNSMSATCEFYSNNTNSCEITFADGKTNSEKIVNWGAGSGDNYFNAKEYYSENRTCLPYVVFVKTEALINGYEIYAASDYTQASTIETNRSAYGEVTMMKDNAYQANGDEDIESHIEMLSDIGKYFELDDYCKNDNGIYRVDFNKAYELCRNKMQMLYSNLNEWDKYIADKIAKGELDENSEIVKRYYSARDNARKQFDETFDDSQYDNPNGEFDNPSSSTWNKTDGNTLALAKRIYDMLRIIIPLLVIILSIVDFLKVILLSDDKNYKAAWSKFIKRIIIGIIFFAVPALITLLLNISGLGDNGILNVFA